ncbi:MAG: hypothetical protein ACRCRT_05355 [Cetobacterium somerae]
MIDCVFKHSMLSNEVIGVEMTFYKGSSECNIDNAKNLLDIAKKHEFMEVPLDNGLTLEQQMEKDKISLVFKKNFWD